LSPFEREWNAVIAICARDIARWIRDWKNNLVFSLFFPIAFMGILGGTIGQNLADNVGYNYLQFVLLGMIANITIQFTMMGVSSLVEERETGFTQEIFVSPVSRYSIILGKIFGASLTALPQIAIFFLIGEAMGVPLTLEGVGLIFLVLPVMFLLGGALGVLVSGIFSSSPKAVDQAVIMIMFPQMFLSGALIPIGASTGILGILVRLMPATYMVDLLRAVFYQGTPTYGKVVLFNPVIDLVVALGLSIAFLVAGTFLFARNERNR
jgi:ABC-2 type transport system permease protein